MGISTKLILAIAYLGPILLALQHDCFDIDKFFKDRKLVVRGNDGGYSMIEASRDNYAVSSRELADNDMDAVVVEGQTVTIYPKTCEKIEKSHADLSQAELALIEQAKSLGNKGLMPKTCVFTNILELIYNYGTTDKSLEFFVSKRGNISNGPTRFAYHGDKLPKPIWRVVRADDVVTYLHLGESSKKLVSKPVTCLNPEEISQLYEISQELQKAKLEKSQKQEVGPETVNYSTD